MKKLLQWFREWSSSIQAKMFLRTTVVIMAVIVTLVFLLHVDMRQRVQDQMIEQQQLTTESVLSELDIFMMTLMAKTDVLYVDTKFSELIETVPVSLTENISITTELKSMMETSMFNVRYPGVVASNYRGGQTSSCLYVKNKAMYLDEENIDDFDDIAGEPFVKRLEEAPQSFSWNVGVSKKVGRYLAFNRWILNSKGTERIAVLQVRITFAKIRSILAAQDREFAVASFYVDEAGSKVVASGDESVFDEAMARAKQGGSIMWLDQGRQAFVFNTVKSTLNDYELICIYSMDVVEASTGALSVMYLLIGMVAVSISGILLFLVCGTLMKGIRQLVNKTKLATVGAEQYEHLDRVEGSREITELDDAYTHLVRTINTLHRKEKDYEEAINEVQAELLQEQFNPHLLYNTLAMIRYMEKENGQTRIYNVLDSLINFYKRVLNRGQLVSRVSEEMDMIENYLSIVREVYDLDLTSRLCVDKDIGDYCAVKMFLQPIVENAILHGIRQIGAGTLEIDGVKEGDMLHFTIEDDGAGMEPETLAEITQMIGSTDDKEPPHSYGYVSVAKRLRLFFGNAYRMTIRSAPGECTRVEVWIPALREDQISNQLRRKIV